MNLREARRDEIDRFIELLEDAAVWMERRGVVQWKPGSMAAQRRSFESAQADGELFVLAVGADICGGVVVSRRTDHVWANVAAADACYVSKFVVAGDRTGQGIGEEMLRECERIARARGNEFMRLDCVASNEPLARYYQRQGFYPRGTATSGGMQLLRHDKRLLTPPWSPPPAPFVPDRHATLMFIERDGEILLIRKKRGHGAGKINGPGGMVEYGETPLQCALRETTEEVGVRVEGAVALAELRFYDGEGTRMLGVAFKARVWSGDPVETAEAAPFWCPIGRLPYDSMWEDDILWLPWLLGDRPVVGEFLMHGEHLVSHQLYPAARASLNRLAAKPIT